MPYAECLVDSYLRHGVHILNEDCYYTISTSDPPAGLHFFHRAKDGSACGGYVNFTEGSSPRWKVEQLEPLTISPSVWCKGPDCGGFHGWIRDGKWVAC